MKQVPTLVSLPLIQSLLYSSTLVLFAASANSHAATDATRSAASAIDAFENSSTYSPEMPERTDESTGRNAATAPSIYHLYVDSNGDDSGSGSINAPFRTISKAAAMAKPSTTIHVAPGVYAGNVTTNNSGTSSGRIRFESAAKWGAKIVGIGSGAHWTNNGDFVDVSGFDISGPGRLGIMNNGSNTLINGNHVHDLTFSGGCNGLGGAGIVNADYKAADADIIGNVVHDIGIQGTCNGAQGIYHSNQRGKIMNNIVYRVSAWGIHLWHAANNVVVANNTVFNNGSARMGGGIATGSGDSPGGVILNHTRVINNIVYNNPGASITQFCYAGVSCIGSSNITSNNLVYGNGRGISLRTGTATGTITADPQFVNYRPDGNGNYRLQRGSPAVNTGTANAAPSYDIDNDARSNGGVPDIGAYESF